MPVRGLLPLLAAMLLAGCVATAPEDAPPPDRRAGPPVLGAEEHAKIAALTDAIAALGPGVDREEAARAARIAVAYPLELALRYRIEDPPLVHNMKVNMGSKPRGLCKDWADDLEARLRQERFRTLGLHRAIANADTILIDHSTVIVSRRGGDMHGGIVLDPWRQGGGRLFWSPVRSDTRYRWVPRAEVFEMRRAREARGR